MACGLPDFGKRGRIALASAVMVLVTGDPRRQASASVREGPGVANRRVRICLLRFSTARARDGSRVMLELALTI